MPETNILVLNTTEAVPVGTPSGTVIVRTSGVETSPTPTDPIPTPAPLEVIATSATYGATVMGTTVTIPKPEGVVNGDLLVAVFHNSSVGTLGTYPTGWELLHELPQEPSLRLTPILGLRVTDASSLPASWTFTSPTNGRMVGTIFRVRGAETVGNIVTGTSRAAVNSGRVATLASFDVSAPSLVIVAASGQITTQNSWALPAETSDSRLTKVFENINNPAATGTATQSSLTVWAGVVPQGALGSSTITWENDLASRSVIAVSIKGD